MTDDMRCDLIKAYARLLRSAADGLTQSSHALTEENRASVLRRLSLILSSAKDLQSELTDSRDKEREAVPRARVGPAPPGLSVRL